MLIGLGLWQITVQKKIFYSRFAIIFIAVTALLFVPLLYPNNALAEQSYSRLFGLLAGLLLFISLQQFQFSRSNIQRLLLLIVLAGFLQSCYGLMQDYLLTAGNIFGYNVGSGRPNGIFQQPNVLASFMATTLILAGYLLQHINNRKLQFFLLLSILLNMWVITITMSRTAYLGLLIALLLFIPWAYQNNKKKLGAFIVALLLGIGIGSMKADSLGARNIENGKKNNIVVRIDMYQHSWDMIKKQPLMGYGYGGFDKNYLISHAQRVKNGEVSATDSYDSYLTHPHNDTLFWAVEGGVVPVLAILLLAVCFLRLLRPFKFTRAMALLALIVPIALHTQTEYPLYHSALHWLVLLVLVFYIDFESEPMQAQQFRPTFALRSFALLIPFFTTAFMTTNLHAISKITSYERSPEPDIRMLMEVVNPFVFADRLDFHFNDSCLSLAVSMDKKEEVQSVIDWAEKAIMTKPKLHFYLILYHAYMHHNQQDKAQQTLLYARYLYPNHKALNNID